MTSSLTGRVLGKYQVAEKLGSGGMADVFRGIQIGLDREVAIKVLPKTLAADREMVRRFRRESQATAKLSHPNIITIYDSGEQDGFYFYVMEFLKTESLEDLLERERPLPVARALKIGQDLLKALVYCHEKEILHRDLKPANIKFDMRDNAILTDFGLVKELDGTAITSAGRALGTPKFMAPEQLTGTDVDARTDLYQAGAILFEMACPTACSDHKARTAALGEVPEELASLVRRALEEDRAARFPNAREMLAELKRIELKLKAKKISRPTSQVSRAPSAVMAPESAVSSESASASAPPLSAYLAAPTDREGLIRLLVVTLPVFVLGLCAVLWYSGIFPTRADANVVEKSVDVQTTRITISWKTDRECFSQVEWGVVGQKRQRTMMAGEAAKEHKVMMDGLTPGTVHVYRFLSGDSADKEPPYATPDVEVSTRPKIVISEIHADASQNHLTVTWETNVPTDSTLKFGPRLPYSEQRSNLEQRSETVHSVSVEGLTTNTPYFVQIVATDPTGRCDAQTSGDREFRTEPEVTKNSGIENLIRSYIDKLKRMTPDEREKLRGSISKFSDLSEALSSVEREQLLKQKTNPRDAEVFTLRLQKARRWLVDLVLAGKPVADLAAAPAILEKLWLSNPIQGGRRLDLYVQQLHQAEARPVVHDAGAPK